MTKHHIQNASRFLLMSIKYLNNKSCMIMQYHTISYNISYDVKSFKISKKYPKSKSCIAFPNKSFTG
jgi:hypothetical protein